VKKTYGKVKYLPNKGRVIVEFANTYKHFNMQQAKLGGANVQEMSAEESGNGVLRFIFYVKDKVEWDIHFVPSSEGEGARLQLDIKTVKKNLNANSSEHIVATIRKRHSIDNSTYIGDVIKTETPK